MLTLNSTEVKIVRAWAEKAESSPFPQEQSVVRRLKQNTANLSMMFSRKELEVVFYWAEKETSGPYGTEQYMLEMESALFEKIEGYLNQ